MKFAIAGAGFSGAVLAQELAKSGHRVEVYESRSHVAGNCYTVRDPETGVLQHQYGPHIFHTDNKRVWSYVNEYAEFMPYVNRVKTTSQGKVFSLPINLHTINQYFNKTLSPSEAKKFIQSIANTDIESPESFEDQALKFVGRDLYEAFFKGYTLKQWGVNPSDLPASILQRLPVRFSYDDNYFNHRYQGVPRDGYTPIVSKLLQHKNIGLNLNASLRAVQVKDFDHVFSTGAIDSWFGYEYGRLGYRTLDFVKEVHEGDYQGCAVMNYGDQEVPYTRISEHKHFAPWESHEQTIVFKEYSRGLREGDTPYYPVRLINDKAMLGVYLDKAKEQPNVSFLGRLGTYRYLDMDVTIAEALDASKSVLQAVAGKRKIATFFIDPS